MVCMYCCVQMCVAVNRGVGRVGVKPAPCDMYEDGKPDPGTPPSPQEKKDRGITNILWPKGDTHNSHPHSTRPLLDGAVERITCRV